MFDHSRILFVNPAGMFAEPIKTLCAFCDDRNTLDMQTYENCSWFSGVPFCSITFFSKHAIASTFLTQGLQRKAFG